MWPATPRADQKTMTNAQLDWAIRKGFAWEDAANDEEYCVAEMYWTREGCYMWNVYLQLYEMVK